MDELYTEIRELINLKQEGSYWDFKREWYKNNKNADLLHDIICMANNLSNRDGYIIIGVKEAYQKACEDALILNKMFIEEFKTNLRK